MSVNKYNFGITISKSQNPAKPLPGKVMPKKFTPTSNRTTQKQNAVGFGRGLSNSPQVDEPVSPGGTTGDRMAYFRQSMEEEKVKKEQEEEKKKLAEEKRKEVENKLKNEEEERTENLRLSRQNTTTAHEEECEVKHAKKTPCRSISDIVKDWSKEMTKDYPGVEVKNFSTSWANGLAFCALIHKFNPDEFDFNELKPENKRHNLDLAFNTGHKVKQIPILLDTRDLLRMKKPEPRSIQTYVQWIWSVYGAISGYGPTPEEVQNASLR